MKSAIAFTAFFLGLMTFSVAAADQPAAPPPAPQSAPASQPADEIGARIVVRPAAFDFGEVWQGAEAKGEFHIQNTGNAPLTTTVTSSCGCTVATKPKSPLQPGESDVFTITYDTRRAGAAGKKVMINSNDPTQPTISIDVKGTVKPIFAATPPDCNFANADENTVATQTVRLENQYPEPLPLRIKPGQNIKQFEYELKEVEAGKIYELTVTTKPPLSQGKNMTVLAMETGRPDLPEIQVRLSAHVMPRASLSPYAVYVTPSRKEPWETVLNVQYRTDQPLKVLAVHCDLETIQCELMPHTPPAEGATLGYYQIKVKLPPFHEIPVDGAKIIIETDDPDPKFAKLEAPVTRREGRKRSQTQPTTQRAPGGTVVPGKAQPAPEK